MNREPWEAREELLPTDWQVTLGHCLDHPLHSFLGPTNHLPLRDHLTKDTPTGPEAPAPIPVTGSRRGGTWGTFLSPMLFLGCPKETRALGKCRQIWVLDVSPHLSWEVAGRG